MSDRVVATLLFLGLGLGLGLASAKTLQRCELADVLLKHNISRGLVKHWVCLAENESFLNTEHLTENPDQSSNYGIFQINSYWCGKPDAGGKCNIKCDDLLNEEIGDDFECALKIYKERRFSAWQGWRKGCKRVHLEEMSTC